jgi:ankyrin repeat protein
MSTANHDPLTKALQANEASELVRLLNAGRNVTERFHFGCTPLHVAAESGSLECARVLLERGADIEAHDEAGHTALIHALGAGHAGLAAVLINAGALLDYRFTPKDTPEIRDQLRRTYEKINTQARQAHPEVYRVLDEASLDIDQEAFAREMAESLVAVAISPKEVHAVHHCANLATLQLLAQRPSISWNIHDGAGDWPLKTFAESGDADIVAWLLGRDADPNFTSTGDTALHAAVARGHLECARLLLHAGANPNQQDVDGCVPMYRVASDEMLDLLLAHGADPCIGDQCDFKPSHWVEDPKLKARLLALERQTKVLRPTAITATSRRKS